MSISTESGPTPVPYAPSALNRFFAAVERLPGGVWWVYPLMFVALLAYQNVMLWVLGVRPVGSFTLDGAAALPYGPYAIGVTHYMTRVAARAMDAFRPASGLSDADFARRRYELITLPAGMLWLPLVIGTIVAAGAIQGAPTAAIVLYGGTREAAAIVMGPASLFGYGMFAIVFWYTVRQLRQVDRLHHEATALDLFDTGPIYAFSRLTVQVGLAYVFVAYYTLVANASFQIGNAFSLGSMAVSISVGVACFFLPLWGIHGRLAAEKAALIRGVNLRAQALQEDLYRRVDGASLGGVGDVTSALTGIHATREQINRLPTWPWPPQVLRGFISAILLPVIVFLISRYAGNLLL